MKERQKHLLLQKAYKFEKSSNNPAPSGCEYDFGLGVWIIKETGEIMAETPKIQGLETKKNDIETGEDLKSE